MTTRTPRYEEGSTGITVRQATVIAQERELGNYWTDRMAWSGENASLSVIRLRWTEARLLWPRNGSQTFLKDRLGATTQLVAFIYTREFSTREGALTQLAIVGMTKREYYAPTSQVANTINTFPQRHCPRQLACFSRYRRLLYQQLSWHPLCPRLQSLSIHLLLITLFRLP